MQQYHANSIQKILSEVTIGSGKTDIKTKNFTREKDTHFIRAKMENPSQGYNDPKHMNLPAELKNTQRKI